MVMDKINDIKTGKEESVRDLVSQFSKSGGFTAKMFADGVDIFRKMLADKKCVKFFSL
jgi:deoxyhypusine synthase